MIKILLKLFGLAVFFVASVILLLILFFWIYVFVNSTGILVSYDNYLFQKRIREHLLLRDHEVSIKELTTFEWDTICIYPPYGDFYYDDSGRITSHIKSKTVSSSDGIYLVQFIKQGSEMAVFQLKRWMLAKDFESNLQLNCFAGDAKFIFKDQDLTTITN